MIELLLLVYIIGFEIIMLDSFRRLVVPTEYYLLIAAIIFVALIWPLWGIPYAVYNFACWCRKKKDEVPSVV